MNNKRAAMGLARTGSHVGNGSGDVMIGFSIANVIKDSDGPILQNLSFLKDDMLDGPFHAVVEAEEEAILNSMIAADTVVGYNGEKRDGLREYI